MRKKLFFLLLLLATAVFFLFRPPVRADVNDDLREVQQRIEEYERKIAELENQAQTLASTIAYLDNRINLTTAQISQTELELQSLEKEIAALSKKIETLDLSLSRLSQILTTRVKKTYQQSFTPPLYLVFSSGRFSDLVFYLKYLHAAQLHDRQLMFQMEETRFNYDAQKKLKEEKQAEAEALKEKLEQQKTTLANQKREKEKLLEITRNDEKRFQQLLAAARAELEAIQSIIAGQGEETEVGHVSAGEKIATVIQGASACSTGTHLHFEVVKGGAHTDPAAYLKPKSVSYADDLVGRLNLTGSWDWPLNDPITITQEYGMSYWARVLNYYNGGPHTGIDMQSPDSTVKAVQPGTLYRGSIPCGGGTLRYVHVAQEDGLDTYYLHVNYY